MWGAHNNVGVFMVTGGAAEDNWRRLVQHEGPRDDGGVEERPEGAEDALCHGPQALLQEGRQGGLRQIRAGGVDSSNNLGYADTECSELQTQFRCLSLTMAIKNS